MLSSGIGGGWMRLERWHGAVWQHSRRFRAQFSDVGGQLFFRSFFLPFSLSLSLSLFRLFSHFRKEAIHPAAGLEVLSVCTYVRTYVHTKQCAANSWRRAGRAPRERRIDSSHGAGAGVLVCRVPSTEYRVQRWVREREQH